MADLTPHRNDSEPFEQTSSKPVILLVDDHADTSMAVKMLLERRGYEVRTAGSGRAALEIAKVAPLNLIISDIGLPDETGHTMLPKLREFTNAPAIALSGFGTDADREQSKAAGFAAHLTKPFDIKILRETIETILKQNHNDGSSQA